MSGKCEFRYCEMVDQSAVPHSALLSLKAVRTAEPAERDRRAVRALVCRARHPMLGYTTTVNKHYEKNRIKSNRSGRNLLVFGRMHRRFIPQTGRNNLGQQGRDRFNCDH